MTSVLHYRDPTAYRTNINMSTANYASPHMATMKKSPSYEGQSSGSERKMSCSSGVKKRPSRAGTRSVTTLTAAQLERKRANDREAQRAIRQRTKDHIDGLERQVRDLTAQVETGSSGKMMEVLRRNDELEQENAVLRARLSHAIQALGMQENAESATVMAATGGAPSPSDRIQILSQPRRASSTARSVHSAQEMANTPVSQPTHWQTQHAYASNMPSPHVEHPQTSWNGLPQSHQANPTVSISIPNPSLHSGEPVSYPNSYGMENNARAMSYPLENSSLVTSQSMQMGGYNTPPTSNPSPHPDSYQRHMSVPMNAPPPAPHGPHQHPHSYSSQGHQGYVPQSSHPGDLQMMAHSPHPQSHIGRVGSIAVPYGVEYDG